jgi:hypothetical protein
MSSVSHCGNFREYARHAEELIIAKTALAPGGYNSPA